MASGAATCHPDRMRIFESFSPTGELRPEPYVRSILALFIGAVLSHLLTAPVALLQFGIMPFVLVQCVLVWLWFCLTVKRAHDAERSILGISAVALIAFISVIFLAVLLILQATETGEGAAASWFPASLSLLTYPFVFLFDLVAGTDDTSQDRHLAFLTLLIAAPPFLTLWWSVWAAVQPSELHAIEQ